MKRITTILIIVIIFATMIPFAAAQGGAALSTDNANGIVELYRLGRGSAEAAAFTPDGSTLVVSGTVGLWLYDPTALDTQTEPTLIETTGEVRGFDISDDGARIAVATSAGQITVWDAATGELQVTFDESSDGWLQFSPDGSVLLMTGSSYAVRAWNVAGNSEIGLLEGHTNTIRTSEWSPDGSIFATAGSDNTIRLWDVSTLSEIAVLEGHTNAILDLAFSSDSSVLVSVGQDETIRAWDVAGAAELAVLEAAEDDDFDTVTAVAFAPDDSKVVTGHSFGDLRIWDSSFNQVGLLESDKGRPEDIDFSPDGSVFTVVWDSQVVDMYDNASNGLLSQTDGHNDSMEAITYSPDGSTLALASNDGHVWLWDTAEKPELTFSTQLDEAVTFGTDNMTQLVYSNDGSVFATVDSFSIRLYTADGTFLRELEGDGITEAVAFSPDDTLIAYTSSRGVYVFDTVSGALLTTLTNHNDWVYDIVWSPDQTAFATSASDHTVRVWGLPQ